MKLMKLSLIELQQRNIFNKYLKQNVQIGAKIQRSNETHNVTKVVKEGDEEMELTLVEQNKSETKVVKEGDEEMEITLV